MKKKVFISWSSGKDSAWALHVLKQDPSIDVAGLFCTITEKFDRVSVHGVRSELVRQQAKSLDLPLHVVNIPYPCSNSTYLKAMGEFIMKAQREKVDCFAFGDLFLNNVRSYREELLKGTGITPIFPIWGIPTESLSRKMMSAGLKAVLSCIDLKKLPPEFAGREYNNFFLNDIPANVDPCGENGEFHSFAFDGPMFQSPIEITIGETIRRENCCFTDLIPRKCFNC